MGSGFRVVTLAKALAAGLTHRSPPLALALPLLHLPPLPAVHRLYGGGGVLSETYQPDYISTLRNQQQSAVSAGVVAGGL